jgi:agmatinase
MKYVGARDNFLGIEDENYFSYNNSKFVIQQLPYEYTSSYLLGSSKGPNAIVKASQFVELYDEELDAEPYKTGRICTLKPTKFGKKVDADAIDLIEKKTTKLLNDNKFVVSIGAEHTVTYGLVKAHAAKYNNLTILQFDAHSDLREEYHDNPYSHASVMKRVWDMRLNIVQVGIRAQCIEEAQLIKRSKKLHTLYAHQIRNNSKWIDEALENMTDNVYITIDADGFDPSVIPAVGTAEPNGLFWNESVELFRRTIQKKNVVGFDIVECAPMQGSILSEYTLAKLAYKLMGYITTKR